MNKKDSKLQALPDIIKSDSFWQKNPRNSGDQKRFVLFKRVAPLRS